MYDYGLVLKQLRWLGDPPFEETPVWVNVLKIMQFLTVILLSFLIGKRTGFWVPFKETATTEVGIYIYIMS